MTQHRCFDGETVFLGLTSRKKYRAIRELIRNTPLFQAINDDGCFENGVIRREKAQTTGLGHGIAFAHGKSPQLPGLAIGLGISKPGVEFDSIDGHPVHFLFLIAHPPHMDDEYVQALSSLAKVVRNDDLLSHVMTCGCPKKAASMLREEFKSYFSMESASTLVAATGAA